MARRARRPAAPGASARTLDRTFSVQHVMPAFQTMQLPAERTVAAPDGSDVRVLLGLKSGGMAHFSLQAGAVSGAVMHQTVEEIWFIVGGSGQMWRRQGGSAEVVNLEVGACLTVPLGTEFQFRAGPSQSLQAVAVTMPPWPGESEALPVQGPWLPTISGSNGA